MRRVGPCLLLSALGCGDSAPASNDLRIGGELDQLVVSEAGEIRLVHAGEVRARLPLAGVALGIVSEISDGHSYDPFWLDNTAGSLPVEPPPGLRWRVAEEATVDADGDALVVEYAFGGSLTATARLEHRGGGDFRIRFEPSSNLPVALHRLGWRASDTEAYYGLGGHPDHVNHRGRRRPMQMEPDLSIESANNELHVPVPLLIGTSGWGMFVASDGLGEFAPGVTEDDLVQVTFTTVGTADDTLEVHLFGVDHPMDVTGRYYALTGQPLRPAAWAYGPLIWRDENDDQAQVLDDIQKIRDLDLATSGIWIDRPYATAVNSFDFRADQFPDPSAMIRAAHDAGLRVALWHTPYLEPATGPLLAEAEAEGYFPPEVGLRLNRWGDPLDFTNPDAYAWWQDNLRAYTDLGIEGFKLDYGEDLLPGIAGARTPWRFFDGSTDRTMHHGYQLLYHQVYAETLPADGGFLLCRAARWGDQRNVSVIWPGDLDADLSRFGDARTDDGGDDYIAVGGLPTAIVMGLNLGPSGFPFFGSDTGGYRHSPPDEETFVRWVQHTALSAVMQVGDSSSQPPWVYTEDNGRDDDTLDLYRRFARLHLRLFPYAWTHAARLEATGHPITRSLGLAHPEIGEHPWDTYLFGADLLVAPVHERGARTRRVTLPAGRWVGWFDGEVYEVAPPGETIEVDAPLEALPLFARAGALIPMLRPTIDTLAPTATSTIDSYAEDPGRLWVRAVPPAGGEATEFTVFDGTALSQDEDGGHRLGYAPGDRFSAGAVFEVHRPSAPASVEVDGAPADALGDAEAFAAAESGWWFEGGVLRVKVGPGRHEVLIPAR